MKKCLVLLFSLLIAKSAFLQSIYPYQEIRLEKPADFRTAEPFALSAANFLLSTSFKKDDHDRKQAFEFLIRWTAGDKDYNFNIQGIILELAEDKDIMQLFLAAMSKFCLENKALGSNTKLIESYAVKTVLDYSNDPSNNYTLKKKQRKRLESY